MMMRYQGISGSEKENLIDGNGWTFNQWEFLTVSIKMNDNATSSDWRLLKSIQNGGTRMTHTTTYNYLKWVDGGGRTTLGARYYDDKTMNIDTALWGFVYNFNLDNGYSDTTATLLNYGNVGCDSD